MGDVDRDTVAHIANLARLDLSDRELDGIGHDLSRILEYVARLDELDLSEETPTAHPFVTAMPYRPDEVRPSLDLEALMRNAPDAEERSYRVPRILGDVES